MVERQGELPVFALTRDSCGQEQQHCHSIGFAPTVQKRRERVLWQLRCQGLGSLSLPAQHSTTTAQRYHSALLMSNRVTSWPQIVYVNQAVADTIAKVTQGWQFHKDGEVDRRHAHADTIAWHQPYAMIIARACRPSHFSPLSTHQSDMQGLW